MKRSAEIGADAGVRLPLLRERLELSRREFAERIGVSPNSVYKWENLILPIPPYRIKQILKIYNVSQSWLLHGAGKMFDLTGAPETDKALQFQYRRKIAAEFLKETTRELRLALYLELKEEFEE